MVCFIICFNVLKVRIFLKSADFLIYKKNAIFAALFMRN